MIASAQAQPAAPVTASGNSIDLLARIFRIRTSEEYQPKRDTAVCEHGPTCHFSTRLYPDNKYTRNEQRANNPV